MLIAVKHYLLFYKTSERYLELHHIWRLKYLVHAWAASERGELVVGGALEPKEKRGVVMFMAESKAVVEKFAWDDPYVRESLLPDWRVAEWLTVAGEFAISPIAKPVHEGAGVLQ